MAPRVFVDLTASDSEDRDGAVASSDRKKKTWTSSFPAPNVVNKHRRSVHLPSPALSTSADPKLQAHGRSKRAHAASQVYLASKASRRKRSVKEAFGRTGVTELLDLTQPDPEKVAPSSKSNARSTLRTSSRNSMNDLLARIAITEKNSASLLLDTPTDKAFNSCTYVGGQAPSRSRPTAVSSPNPGERILETVEIHQPISWPVLAAGDSSERNNVESLKPKYWDTFNNSNLNNRLGRPWTDAETVMVAYLYEVAKLPWTSIDKKLGRGYNSCASKYTRIPTGLKNSAVREKMRLIDRLRAIQAMLNTIDLDINEVTEYLQRYIETGSLPRAAAEDFRRLSEWDPTADTPIFGTRDGSAIVDNSRASSSSPSSSDLEHSAVYTMTRKKRVTNSGETVSLEGLRLNSCLLAENAELNSAHERGTSPDSGSIHDSSPEISLVNQPEDLRLFDFTVNPASDHDSGYYIQRKKPYLSIREMSFAKRAIAIEQEEAGVWQGTTLHHGFSLSEITAVIEAINRACPELYDHNPTGQLHKLLSSVNDAQLNIIASLAAQDNCLRGRTRKSIRSFLSDAIAGRAVLQPSRVRISRRRFVQLPEQTCPTKQLLQRELGIKSYRSSISHVRDALYDTMTVTRSFTGTSGDVGNLAWSPTGIHFAAGSACLVDQNNMQYNQPNNLLFGNTEQNMLYELPHHHRERPKVDEGVNALHSMHMSQDSRLFETVSMVEFSSDGAYMFSVGYDHHLRMYKVDGNRGCCNLLDSFDHNAKIDLLNVSRKSGLLATGSANVRGGVKIFKHDDLGLSMLKHYSSPRANSATEGRIMPSALKWGVHSSVAEYLMVGFSSNTGVEMNAPPAHGELCLWNVEKDAQIQVAPAAGEIFDCSWSASSGLFLTACAAYGVNLNRGTRSLVRVYSPLQEAGDLRWTTRGLQLECPALDINDVIFNPYNQMHVAAGATDGSIYVWDLRNPDNILHRLSHGQPLMELDPDFSREAVDTGVRFCSWADRTSRLYSGSSDGILKVWDIHRATEDAHVKDLASFSSGIMSGAFANDYSKLLIGEVNGSINLLELGADPRPLSKVENFVLQNAEVQDAQYDQTDDEHSGVAIARNLVRDGKIEIRALGGYPKRQALQGPAYDGPYDRGTKTAAHRAQSALFQHSVSASSPQCSLSGCKSAGNFFGAEEIGDSGRSQDRIPQALRDCVKSVRPHKMTGTSTLKCTHCDWPARVREDDLSQAAFPLCERCSFACIRCGESIKLSPMIDQVHCRKCGLEWNIGVLGYQLKPSYSDPKRNQKSDRESLDDSDDADEQGVSNEVGDLLHLVEEHHHSLWEDQKPVQC
ncbi:uncharacterized protein PV09_09241 [Verruconis gallopava]|uniref:Uncharacterized protein n=1 Tax=Verruconis gallopava TaxID=253628 RepID=A0A0D1ZX61_9PEZI|nr:uncharacterized protein PV09_09241 [Verruconis gallopava]KIV99012.1 hypothetical protein PV09_09241 [Verruconis gallopava]